MKICQKEEFYFLRGAGVLVLTTRILETFEVEITKDVDIFIEIFIQITFH